MVRGGDHVVISNLDMVIFYDTVVRAGDPVEKPWQKAALFVAAVCGRPRLPIILHFRDAHCARLQEFCGGLVEFIFSALSDTGKHVSAKLTLMGDNATSVSAGQSQQVNC